MSTSHRKHGRWDHGGFRRGYPLPPAICLHPGNPSGLSPSANISHSPLARNACHYLDRGSHRPAGMDAGGVVSEPRAPEIESRMHRFAIQVDPSTARLRQSAERAHGARFRYIPRANFEPGSAPRIQSIPRLVRPDQLSLEIRLLEVPHAGYCKPYFIAKNRAQRAVDTRSTRSFERSYGC